MATIAAVVLSGSTLATSIGYAQASLIAEEQHWKYSIDRWIWDEERRVTYGLMKPQIIIQNETADRLEGYIADVNGTRLEVYDSDQIVHVRFISGDFVSSWEMAGMVEDGYFAIDIPERYRDAEFVRIMIGSNYYSVDNGTPTTPQTEVHINSAILVYSTNSTLVETEVAAEVEEPKLIRSVYQGGSLIDWILSRNGMLPVGSPNPGE